VKKSRIQIASLLTLAVFMLTALAVAPAALASKGQVLLTDINGTPKQYWRVGEVAFITVIDPDENRDSDEVEMLTGTVKTQLGNDEPILQICAGPCAAYPGLEGGDSLSSADGKQLVLQETGTNTGVFRSLTGILITKAVRGEFDPNNGTLEVTDTDTIFVRYQDPTNPNDISIGLGKLYTGDAPGSRGRAIISITDAGGTPTTLTDVGRTIFVTVTDADENTNPATIESLKVILRNERIKGSLELPLIGQAPGVLELTLVETGPNTGVFRNVDGVVIVDEKNQGRSLGSLELFARDKDTLIAYYRTPADLGVAPPPPTKVCESRTVTQESALARYERTAPISMKPGEECPVKVVATAKTALRALLVSDRPDAAFTVTGDTRGAGLNLAAGGKVELNYRVRAGAAPGTFSITGDATPATDAGPQAPISLSSSINVAASSTSAALRFAALRVDSASSDLATISRDVPDRAAVGREFEVKVTVTAKQTLRAVLVSDELGGLTLVGGTVSRAGTISPLNPGQSFTHTYKLTCPAEGTFTISGRAIPVTGAGSQAPIALSSTVVCGPTAPIMVGMGDDNDPHDFAIAQVKVAERNPATIRFTDATGTERRDFRIGEGLFVEVRDADQNADSDRVERIAVSVYDVNGGRELDLVLVETGINTGIFRNTGPLQLVPKATAACAEGGTVKFTTHPDVFNDEKGVMAVGGDNTIYAIYDDARVEVVGGRDEIKRALDAYDVVAVTAVIRESDLAGFDKKLRFTNDMGQPVTDYKVGNDAFVQLDDADSNYNSDTVDTVVAVVVDRNTGDRECITLFETGPNTGLFFAKLGLQLRRPGTEPQTMTPAEVGDGILQMQDRDIIEAHYQDADNPQDYAATSIGIIPLFDPPAPPVPTEVSFVDAAGKTLLDAGIGDDVYVQVKDEGRKGLRTLTNAVTLTVTRAGSLVSTLTLTLTETATLGTFRSEVIKTGGYQDKDELKAEYTLDPKKPTKSLTLRVKEFKVERFTVSRNPMSDRTTFEAVGTGIEKIEVHAYDLSGRLVFTGSRAGATLDWNGTSAGELLGNGVYLYVVTASGMGKSQTSNVSKLVILR
jgi:hypothetical protein